MRGPGVLLSGFLVSGSWSRCMHRVLSAFDILCLPLLRGPPLHRWRFRECARLNVLNDKTCRSPSGRTLILPILPVVTGFQLRHPTAIFHLYLLPLFTPSASISTPNPTNTVNAILTVMCTCAPLLSLPPSLPSP